MSNIVWLGAALLWFSTCLTAQPQNPSVISPGGYPSNVLSLSVNTKKCVHTISDHFLGITFEPSVVFSALQNNLGSTAINMARGLSPAYLRISGPECNYFRFRGGQDTALLSPARPTKQGRNNVTITGWHWSQLNEFVAKTGLDLIVGLNVMNRQQGKWDLSNVLDLISYSDKRGYDMAFQLGNDIHSIESRVDGSSLGRDATRLRKVLEAFPRYANSAIIGPDVKSCETQEEARYLKDFITESGSSILAVPYQVPFSSEKNVENPTAMFNYVQNQMEIRVWQKDMLNKYLGRIGNKKPLWIVESGSRDRRGDFVDGLNWAQRLCAGARVGINTILRKPSLLSLSEPTPDYWVSVLHKALVSTEVLDIKFLSGNKTRLETVAHCTKMSPFDPNEGILAPEYRYNRGSVTVFGVNTGLENVKILLKTGEKQSLPLHQYVLTGVNRQHVKRTARSLLTMLNGQKLILSPDGELPILSPKIRGSHQLITIPGQSVFFIVLPESKSKACAAVQIEEPKESYKNGGKIIVAQDEFDETDYDTPVLDQEDELVSNEKNNYVAFRHKYTTRLADESTVRKDGRQGESKADGNGVTAQEINEQLSSDNDNENSQQPEPIVKYITFSNNNWLSKFPKSLNNQEYSAVPSSHSPTEATRTTTVAAPTTTTTTTTTAEVQTERGVTPSQSRREKYHILAQAVVGKRYPEKNVRSENQYPNLDSAVESIRPSQRLKLIKRSVDRRDEMSSKEINEMLERFTNDEKRSPNTISNAAHETSSTVPRKPNADGTEDAPAERPKKTFTQISAISEAQRSTTVSSALQTSQETATTTPGATTTDTPHVAVTAVTKPLRLRAEKAESSVHVQKIKTRAEQALARAAKLNEKTSKKHEGRRLRERQKDETTHNPTAHRERATETTRTTTAPSGVTAVGETEPGFVEKFRYNRQTNGTTTESGDLKTVKSRVKSKKSDETAGAVQEERVKAASFPVTEPTTRFEAGGAAAAASAGKGTKLRNFAKTVQKPTRPRTPEPTADGGKSAVTREIRDTTQQPGKIRPVLGRVKTPANVDAVQIETNGKVTEKLVENLRDGKKTLESEHAAAAAADPSDDVKNGGGGGEIKLQEAKTAGALSASERIRALEARIKARRSEAERRLHSRVHRVGKRSPTRDRVNVENDATEHVSRHGYGDDDGFAAGPGRVTVAQTAFDRPHAALRYPRSVADFTMKLNEVNTFVDKRKKSANNEILGADDDGGGGGVAAFSRPKGGWTNAYGTRLPAADYDGERDGDASSAKSKRKSVFESLSLLDGDDDFGGKTTADVMNKLLSQVHKIWKYIKKTFLF